MGSRIYVALRLMDLLKFFEILSEELKTQKLKSGFEIRN